MGVCVSSPGALSAAPLSKCKPAAAPGSGLGRQSGSGSAADCQAYVCERSGLSTSDNDVLLPQRRPPGGGGGGGGAAAGNDSRGVAAPQQAPRAAAPPKRAASEPVRGGGKGAPPPPPAQRKASGSSARGGSTLPPSQSASSAATARCNSQRKPLEALMQVQDLQNALAAVSEAPGLGLSEAAELLQQELGVAHVSIFGFCAPTQEAPEPAAVVLASCGAGAEVVEATPVSTAASCAPLRLRATARDSLFARASTDDEIRELPDDWKLLHRAGLRAFRAVPIGPASGPWGALVLATPEADGLQGSRWRVWPNVAAVALVHQVRHWQTAAVCKLLRAAEGAESGVALISLLLRGARSFLDRATNMRTGVRLAVLDAAGQRALVFEPAASPFGQAAPGALDDSVGRSVSGARPDGPPLVASEMGLSNTLLASAVALKKARFVRDCTSYMQSSAAPARDLFTQPAVLVSSLVVVPLVHGAEEPRTALYLTLEAPNDFAAAQAPLLGFVSSVLPLVHQKVTAHLGDIWGYARAVRSANSHHSKRLRAAAGAAGNTRSSPRVSDACSQGLIRLGSGGLDGANAITYSGVTGGVTGGVAGGVTGVTGCPEVKPRDVLKLLEEGSDEGAESGDDDDDKDDDATMRREAACYASSELATCSSARLCTEAMVKAVEQEILQYKRFSCELPTVASSTGDADSRALPPARDLALSDVIGAGGFGVVWKGAWKNMTAAIKVMRSRATEQEAMKDAVEMAVLSTVNHPNVVQVFACLTDMVEEESSLLSSCSLSAAAPPPQRRRRASDSSAQVARGPPPSYRPLAPFGDPEDMETCNIIVMEYCDLGSLRRVLLRGAFHRRIGGGNAGSLAVDLPGLLYVALEVAEAVAYLHSIRLCHCDVKLDNVLMKSEVSQPRGFIAKLADFGLVKVLGATGAAVNVNGMGTVSHLAPELFVAGSRITTAADVFSFGILLYELYMGGAHAYAGLDRQAIIERVALAGMRPHFPAGAPKAYADLAAACWSGCAAQRPAMAAVIAALQRMLAAAAAGEPL